MDVPWTYWVNSLLGQTGTAWVGQYKATGEKWTLWASGEYLSPLKTHNGNEIKLSLNSIPHKTSGQGLAHQLFIFWLLYWLNIVLGTNGFLGGSHGKESACNARGLGSIPGLGRSPGGRQENPLEYCCLENSMDRGAWWTTVHGILQTRTLEWVAGLFSKGSSQTRDRTQASCIAGRFFTSWATRKPRKKRKSFSNQ